MCLVLRDDAFAVSGRVVTRPNVCGGGGINLTGHIQLPSLEPLDPAPAQVAVLDRVEGTDPAQSVTRHRGPEAVAAGDGEVLQRRAARRALEARGLRHERRRVTGASSQNTHTGPEAPTPEGSQNRRGASTGQPHRDSDRFSVRSDVCIWFRFLFFLCKAFTQQRRSSNLGSYPAQLQPVGKTWKLRRGRAGGVMR